jgi:D-xylose transport system permease protein
LSNLAVEVSITAVLSLGMLLIILPGHIDLSVGSGAGLFGGIAAVLVFNHGWPAAAAMGLAIVAAVAIWFVMGALIVTQRIPAFIVTLAGLLVFRGFHWMVIRNSTVPVTVPGAAENIYAKLTTYYLPPAAGIALGVVVIAALAAAQWVARQRRAKFGFELEPSDMAVAKVLIAAQLVALFVLVTNAHRGIPL